VRLWLDGRTTALVGVRRMGTPGDANGLFDPPRPD